MNMHSALLHRGHRHTDAARKCFLAPLQRPPQIVAHTRTRITSWRPTCRARHSRRRFVPLLLRSGVYRLLLCILFFYSPIYCNLCFFFLLKNFIHSSCTQFLRYARLFAAVTKHFIFCCNTLSAFLFVSFAKYLFLCLQINNLLVHTVCSFVAIKSCRNSSHVTI